MSLSLADSGMMKLGLEDSGGGLSEEMDAEDQESPGGSSVALWLVRGLSVARPWLVRGSSVARPWLQSSGRK